MVLPSSVAAGASWMQNKVWMPLHSTRDINTSSEIFTKQNRVWLPCRYMRFPLILAHFLSLLLDHWCSQKSENLNIHTASLNINARTLTIVANNAAFLCHVNYTSILMKPLLTFRVLSSLCLCQDFGLVYANNADLHVNPEQVPDISERACFCKCAFQLRSMPHQGCFKLTAVQFCSPTQDRCHFICLHILKVTHRGLSFISKCYYSSLCIETNTIIHNYT